MAVGTATIDFGTTPTDTAEVLVSGLTGLTANSHLEPFIQSDSTADNSVDAHQQLAARCNFYAEYISASSFKIYADVFIGFASGTFKLHYATA